MILSWIIKIVLIIGSVLELKNTFIKISGTGQDYDVFTKSGWILKQMSTRMIIS